MENFPDSDLYDSNPLQQRRVDDLMRHAYLLTLHEELALAWERTTPAPNGPPPDTVTRHAELAAIYEEDLGVPPEWRHELQRRIEEAIAGRRQETLAELIRLVRVQSQNPSSVSTRS